jgi:serine/threonine-protein kinase
MKTCPVCDTDYPDQHTTCPTDGAVLIVSHERSAGDLVRGKYRIIRKLGQGGMGVVYLADDTLLGVQVALKFLAANLGKDPKFIKRFRNEARAAYQLRHPNIVEVTGLDQAEDGSLFIAMEYLQGQSLTSYGGDPEFAEFEHPVQRALNIARQIASGLGAAHAIGLVHRDIKPENILLVRTADGREQAKILDFGIVAMAETGTSGSLTRGLLLTPEYAAPEQWLELPSKEIDGRTDLYALGGVLYQMLTRRTPFHAHTTSGWMKQHLEETPRPPSELRPELADWIGLDSLLLRLLAKDRDQRPRDAAEVIELLNSVHLGTIELDSVQPVSAESHRKTVVDETAARQKTILEWDSTRTRANPSEPAVPDSEPAPGKYPRWAWGAVALLALIAAFAAWRLLAPRTQPQQAETPASQTASQPEAGMGPQTVAIKPASVPAPGSAETEPPPSARETGLSPKTNPAAATESKPSTSKPDIAAISQQAYNLYQQNRYVEAAPLLDQACNGGDGSSCSQLSWIYDNGLGFPKDHSRALTYSNKACDEGTPVECWESGLAYEMGDNGVAQDYALSAAYMAKACNGGEYVGCGHLGVFYENGEGVPKDADKAKGLLGSACNHGSDWACVELKKMP